MRVLIPLLYATILHLLPRRFFVQARRKVQDVIMYAWTRGGRILAVWHSLYKENGNGKRIEDISPYLDKYHDGD